MASSLKMVAPLAALLLIFAITTPVLSQGGLLGGIPLLGGLLGSLHGGVLGGTGGLTNLTGTLLCTPNLILCPRGGSCPPLVNAVVSLNLGGIPIVQTVTNAAGVFQLTPLTPVPNIFNVLPNVTISVTLPASGTCSALPTGVFSSPLMITQIVGNLLRMLPTSFLLL